MGCFVIIPYAIVAYMVGMDVVSEHAGFSRSGIKLYDISKILAID